MRRGEGPWALMSAADGTLWSGGDYVSVVGEDGSEAVGGRLRPIRDAAAHPAGSAERTCSVSLSNGTALLAWAASSTAGGVRTRSCATTASSTSRRRARRPRAVTDSSAGDRFFVRATDGKGNRSASTAVAHERAEVARGRRGSGQVRAEHRRQRGLPRRLELGDRDR